MNWPHNPLPEADLAFYARQEWPDTQGFIPGFGSLSPRLVLVGEAPGETEVAARRPFTGRAGAKLDLMLDALGLTRAQVFITMSFHRRPTRLKPNGNLGNRPPTMLEQLGEGGLLDAELCALPDAPILAMGAVAVRRLCNQPLQALRGRVQPAAIQQVQAGAFVAGPRRLIAACAHPAALLYRRQTQVDTLFDLQQIRQLLEETTC